LSRRKSSLSDGSRSRSASPRRTVTIEPVALDTEQRLRACEAGWRLQIHQGEVGNEKISRCFLPKNHQSMNVLNIDIDCWDPNNHHV
jgi:hypothetical protein